ncbi:MAG: universal stress protein [Bacteroidia bacterium]
MINLNTHKILIPIDFSVTSTLAVNHGAFLCKLTKGELILLHVQKKSELIDIIMPAFHLTDISAITKFLDDKLGKLAEGISKEYGIVVTPLVSMGNITTEIVNIAQEYEAGMIIMGTQGADANDDVFLGSNAYRLLTKSTVPVMTIRTPSPKVGYSTILLPIDFSAHAKQKVHLSIQLAANYGAHLHVLGLVGKDETQDKFKLDVVLPQIQKLAKTKNVVCTTEIKNCTNRTETTLLVAKDKKADLIIIMSDQRAELSRFILGSYAHQLINDSLIPVLSIPPEVHEENIGQDTIGGMWQAGG